MFEPVTWEAAYSSLRDLGFPHDRRVKADCEEARRVVADLAPFLVPTPQGTLLQLRGDLLKSTGMDPRLPPVMLCVTLSQPYPNCYPILTVEPPQAPWRVKRHPNVDTSGNCYLTGVTRWNPSSSKLVGVVQELQSHLRVNFPFEDATNNTGLLPPAAGYVQQQQQQQPMRPPPASGYLQQQQQRQPLPRQQQQPVDPLVPVVRAVVLGSSAVASLAAAAVSAAVLGGPSSSSASGAAGGYQQQQQQQRERDMAWLEEQRRKAAEEQQMREAFVKEAFLALLNGTTPGPPPGPGTEITCPTNWGMASFRLPPNAMMPLQLTAPPPPPLPPCTEPTPDEMHQQAVIGGRAQRSMQTEQAKAEPPPQGGLGKAFRALSIGARIAVNAASDAKEALEAKVRASSADKDAQRFSTLFPQDAARERLVTDYKCSTITGDGSAREGHLFLTDQHVYFSTRSASPTPPAAAPAVAFPVVIGANTTTTGSIPQPNLPVQLRPYQFRLPLASVVTIVKAANTLDTEALHVVSQGDTFRTFFRFVNSWAGTVGGVVATGMSGTTPYDRCYNWLDHKWRAAVVVPPSTGYRSWAGVPYSPTAAAPPPPVAAAAAGLPQPPPQVVRVTQPAGLPQPPPGAPPRTSAAAEEANLCAVCMDNQKNAFFQPCGHVAVCMRCAALLKECPICRKEVTQVFQAFV